MSDDSTRTLQPQPAPPPLPWEREMARLREELDQARGQVADLSARLERKSSPSGFQVGVAAVSRDGTLLHVDEALCRIVGHAPADLVGHPAPHPFWTPESNEALHRTLEVLQAGSPPGAWARVRLARADGTLFDAEVRVEALRGHEGAEVGGSLIVVEHADPERQAELLLRLGAAIGASSDGVGICDLDERYVYVNDSLATMHGYDVDALIGLSWRTLTPTERSPELDGEIARCLMDPTVGRWEGELETLRRDGTRFPIALHLTAMRDAAGAYAGQICYVRDITQRRRHEAELLRLRKAVEASGEAIFLTDRVGIIRYVNPQFTRLYGWTAEEVVGKETPRILKGGALEQDDYESFWAAILSKQIVRREFCNRTRDGRDVWIEASANPIVDDHGEIVGFLAIQSDITERRRLGEQLVQSQKMEAVGRLAGGIAHDYNNILSVIMGYSDLLLSELDTSNPIRGDIEEIHRAAGRAAALTRQLLVFSRREVSRPEVVDVNAVVSSVDRLLRRAVGEDVTLHLDLDPSLPYVHIDASHVEQILMNLVVNARDATPGGGRISIATRSVAIDAEEASRLGTAGVGPHVIIEVADTGHGMGPDIAARAFDPFFTTKPKGLGTGLGLSIVYAIVKQAGGTIAIESEPERGTRCRVYLAATAGTRTAHDAAATAPVVAKRPETILLVEDEDQVRAITQRMLLQRGYHVLEARNAGEAFLLVEQGTETIDLLLTDVVMPQFSGTRLAQRLTKLLPDLRILFMSGYSDAVDRETIVTMGADLVIKPFSRADLLSAVERALA